MADFGIELGLMPVIATPYPLQLILETRFVDGYQINSVGSKIEWIKQIAATGSLTQIGFRYISTLGSGVDLEPPTQRISIQGVDSSTGRANGLVQTSATYRPQVDVIDGPGSSWNQTWQWINVPSATVNVGQLIAIVIEYSSGPIRPPSSSYSGRILNTSSGTARFPYSHANGGFKDDRILVAYKVNGITYGWPIEDFSRTIYSGSAMKGVKFRFDSDWADSFKIAGCTWQGEHASNTNATYSMRLYDGDTEIGRTTVDADHSMEVGSRSQLHTVLFDESTLPELVPDHFYRLVIAADTTGIQMDVYHAPSQEDALAYPGGANLFFTEGSGGSNWSDDGAARPMIDLIVSEWGAPAKEAVGIHLKFTPKYNDGFFIQHSDDQIESNIIEVPIDTEPHEFPGIPIGKAIESYSGYATVEVFLDPDVDRSSEFLIHEEQLIEELKFLRWQPWENGTFEVVFRLRAALGSAFFEEVIRYVRIIV